MRRLIALVGAAVLAGSSLATTAGPAAAASGGGERVTFVVVLKDGVQPGATGREIAREHGGELGFVYDSALSGFSVELPETAAARVARDRRVAFVERDQLFTTTAQEVPTGVERSYATSNANLDIDGVDDVRIDVDIAILDTGLDSDHPDLNIAGGTNCATGGPSNTTCADGTFEDGNGHGTHVGGSAAALDNGAGVVGVAPGARLHGVKVLSDRGSGYTSWIIAGIDWVTARADVIEVANMSLGCECYSAAQDAAIAGSVAAGVTYAVAAGNSDKDASTFSPANHPDVITVSALADFNGLAGGGARATCRADQDDTLADFSNFGPEVEIAAPGVCITSTWPGGGLNTISGTSMASPHVAGAAALLASTRSTGSKADADAIRATLIAEGNLLWTDDSRDGVKEPLLDVGDATVFAPAKVVGDPVVGDPANVAPTASFTSSCTELTCSFTSTSTDTDGTVASWAWNFGDGGSSTAENPSHSYTTAGTYTVSLVVTDDDGAASEPASATVTVGETTSSGISLAATGYKVKGAQKVDLSWSGASGDDVDIVRDDVTVATTANDRAYTDAINAKGGGSYTYRVCEAGTGTCSATQTVVF